MKRKGPFERDVELHGHHKECPENDSLIDMSGAAFVEGWIMDISGGPCTCRELDHDDWIAAGEAEMDRRREEPRERMEDYD